MLDWILTSPQGREEAAQANNHGTAYDAQVIAFALYTGRLETARSYIRDFPSKRIFRQVEPDGSQPEELWRTLSFGYSQYNLSHYIDVCQMARKLGISIDAECSPDGRSFEKAMDFMLPYMGEDVSAWPYQQISGWEDKQQEMARDFYRAYLLDPSRTDYLQAWRKVRVLRFDDRFNLLYMRPSVADQVFAFAEGQFRLAMECTEKAKREETNAARRLVSPCSVNSDGSLALVHPYDWCSGFFPGSLWQVYEYTRDPYWRRQAISFTWPVEEAKWHGGTHDLGFMVNDSFGRAYAMTGERSYLEAVMRRDAWPQLNL